MNEKNIFICSPLRGNIKPNIKRTKEICKWVIYKGNIPFAPHIYFTQFLDDSKTKERNLGIRSGLEWLRLCDELWIFGDVISEGMKKEIKFAKKINIPIKKVIDSEIFYNTQE
jgi:hypothetical protein